jgi:uncharacterized protein with von Willebrand factor type A (vWA) domain
MLKVATLPEADPGALLRTRLTGFTGFLRANGFGGGESTCVLNVAQRVGMFEPQLLCWSLKALLCGRSDEWRRFDGLFDAYFLPQNRKAFTPGRVADAKPSDAAGMSGDVNQSLPIAAAGTEAPEKTTATPSGMAQAARNRSRSPIFAISTPPTTRARSRH